MPYKIQYLPKTKPITPVRVKMNLKTTDLMKKVIRKHMPTNIRPKVERKTKPILKYEELPALLEKFKFLHLLRKPDDKEKKADGKKEKYNIELVKKIVKKKKIIDAEDKNEHELKKLMIKNKDVSATLRHDKKPVLNYKQQAILNKLNRKRT